MDSTMSGGNSSPDDNIRLDQADDAVPMQPVARSHPLAPNDAALNQTTDPPSIPDHPSAAPSLPAAGEVSADVAESSPKAPEISQKDQNVAMLAAISQNHPALASDSMGESDAEAMAADGVCDRPVCLITLLLASGSRHPYKIDGKYLSRRNVVIPETMANGEPDPFSISVYTLKELILREWRTDWEAKPASPSSIRLIHFGKLLDDKEPLNKYHFSPDNPNVVHMSIRPQDLDEEEPKSGSKSLPSGGDGQRPRSEGGCCCILM